MSAKPALTFPATSEIDASCRVPLLLLFWSAAKWLVLGSVLGLIASIKFHSPNFLADCSWLTYGHVRPAAVNIMLYGFCLQAGLGISLWLFARLGRVRLQQGGLIVLGALLLNLGVFAGVLGILAGDTTGFDNLEMPRYAALLFFLGYLLIGIWGAVTFHQRRERRLFVSQWFLLASLFWFPWIYSTANLLVVLFPVRGVALSVIAWWYSNNLLFVWLSLVGLASVFYFVPKLANRELPSRHLALFTFWSLMLFGSWGGISKVAPVPAWIPALSTVATVLTIFTLITLKMNLCGALEGKWFKLLSGCPSLQFIGFGVFAFFVGGLVNVAGALFDANNTLNFTWLGRARSDLQTYGFFAMTSFGAIYYIVPLITGIEFPCAKLVKLHFRLAAAGVLLIVVPLAIGGILEASNLRNPGVLFGDVIKGTLPFLRVSTVGELFLAAGHLLLLGNLVMLAKRLYCARVEAAYAAATADLFKSAEAKS